jgi:hypothetical protein
MNLYLITPTDDPDDWDIYLGAVVAAKDEESARQIHPDGRNKEESHHGWVSPEAVTVKLIGKAARGTKTGVILASYRNG